MADQKKSDFVVSDRRKFTSEGELRPDAQEETAAEKRPEPTAVSNTFHPPQGAYPAAHSGTQAQSADLGISDQEQPPAPSASELHEQAQAYRSQTANLDARIQKELDQRSPGRKASDFEMSFDKFVASLYMTALMQLGLVHEQGAPVHPDIMAARQTIDTIAILAEKTKGNLTPAEDTLMQNVLYELRMAYIEVTNAVTKAPQGPIDPSAGLK